MFTNDTKPKSFSIFSGESGWHATDDDCLQLADLLVDAGFGAAIVRAPESVGGGDGVLGPDAIVVDMTGLGSGGVKCVVTANASDEFRRTPMVVLSEVEPDEARMELFDGLAVENLQPPYTSERVLAALQSAVMRKAEV